MTTGSRLKETEVGMIPEDWKFEELDKHAKVTMGQSPESIFYNSAGEGILFLQGIRTFGYLHPSYDTWTTRITKIAKKGSVLLSVRAPVGEVNLADNDICIGRGLMSIDGDNNKFIFYLFKAYKHYVTRKETGTVYGAVTRDEIAKLPFPFPGEEEQKEVAKMLFCIDSKIELNQQTNNTLEAIGRTIFKHWFVDFEFPNNAGRPYKSSGGEMVYQKELGKEVPEGWEVKHFSEVIEVNPRRELPKGKTSKKVGMADLKPWQSWIDGWALEEYNSGQKFKNGDVLFARITPSLEHGKTAIVSILDDDEIGFGSTEFIVFGKKVVYSEPYIFHLSRSDEIRTGAINAMTGTSGRQRVPDSLFDSLSIVVPPAALVEKFDVVVSPHFSKITANAKEVRTLSQVRDSLLPKLMSGEIRVPMEG